MPICHEPGPGPLATCSGYSDSDFIHMYQLETDIILQRLDNRQLTLTSTGTPTPDLNKYTTHWAATSLCL